MKITHPLDEVGDGTGNSNANVDGSVTPVMFKVAREFPFELYQMTIKYSDKKVWKTAKYGNIKALSNGILIGMFEKGTDIQTYSYLPGGSIRTNEDWAVICYDTGRHLYEKRDAWVSARLNLSQDNGRAFVIPTTHYWGVLIQDDLTGLQDQRFTAFGHSTKPHRHDS